MLSLVTAIAFFAGCGDSQDEIYSVEADTTMTTASIAADRYVPRVNAMCREAWRVIYENFADYSSWQEADTGERRRFTDAVRKSLIAGIEFHMFNEIQNLGAPAAEGPQMEVIMATMQSASERGVKGLEPVSSVAEVARLYSEYNERARRYGIKDCLVDEARLNELKLEAPS